MSNIKVLLVYPNLMLVSTLPNNISQLSACLKHEGHTVKLFDTTLYETTEKSNDEMRVERMQVRKFDIKSQGITLKNGNVYLAFKKLVDEYDPDLVGVTVVDDTVDMGIELVSAAGCKEKGIPVIFGGVHAIFNPDNLLKENVVDMVCTGEGEETLTILSNAIMNGNSFQDIPNLFYKDNKGAIVKSSTLGKPVNLDELPMEDFTLFERQRLYRPMQGKMLKMLPINFDRGCPYRCSFCAAPAFNKMYKAGGSVYLRRKSIGRIKREIEYQLEKYNVEYLYFNSETFLTMPLKQLKELAAEYSEFNLPFWCQTRIETITDEKVRILKEMNCDRVSIGLEHGNEAFRKNILKKHFSNAQVVEAFKSLNRYEINISVNNILGFPDETRELIFDTINLNRRIKADSVSGFIFQPYSGTEMMEYCLEKGYLSENHRQTSSPIGDPVLNMPTISNEELKGLLRTFVLYVKLPETYYPRIKVAERLDEEGDAALEELREILFNEYF